MMFIGTELMELMLGKIFWMRIDADRVDDDDDDDVIMVIMVDWCWNSNEL